MDQLIGDATKARKVLGWKPKYSFEELVGRWCSLIWRRFHEVSVMHQRLWRNTLNYITVTHSSFKLFRSLILSPSRHPINDLRPCLLFESADRIQSAAVAERQINFLWRDQQTQGVHDERAPHQRDEHNLSSVELRTAADVDAAQGTAALSLAGILNTGIFTALLFLIALTAIPYGTVEPWWKAVFSFALVFALCIFAIIEYLLDPTGKLPDRVILTPLFVLAGYALLQSFALSSESNAAIRYRPWNAISADPYQTQFFVLQLLAITLREPSSIAMRPAIGASAFS